VADLIITTSSSNFTWPTTFGKRHHSLPYSILFDSPWRLHSNNTFSQDSQMGVPKIRLLLSQKISCSYLLQIKCVWSMQGKYFIAFKKKKFNNLLHASIRDHLMPTLRGFMVRNQIPNLTLGSSFDHNSCILSLNEQCKNILAIALQDLSNGILGAQFYFILPCQLRFWIFRTPAQVQLPNESARGNHWA